MKQTVVLALTLAAMLAPAAERARQAAQSQSEQEAIRYERWKLKTSQAEARRSRTLRAGSRETGPDEANNRGTAARGQADRSADAERTVPDPGEPEKQQ